MSEPISPTTATAALTGVTFWGYIAGLDVEVIISSFAGSMIFVVLSNNFSITERLFLFMPSFLSGIILSDYIAGIITNTPPYTLSASPAMGALVASILTVWLAFLIIKTLVPAVRDSIREFLLVLINKFGGK